MLHPLIHLLTSQPELLGDHAQAYGELIGSEVAAQARVWKRRSLLYALALCLGGVAAVLCGVSILLWATVAAPASASIALWLVPLAPALLAGICAWCARDGGENEGFVELRRQFQADMDLLRSLAQP